MLNVISIVYSDSFLRALNIRIQDNIASMRDSLEVAASERMAEKIARWLSAPDPSVNLATARKKRHLGTGNWLLDSPIYLDWKKSDCSLLWLHGKVGSGKTVISSTVIYSLLDTIPAKTNVLYFYFDFQDHQKQLVHDFMRYIIVQLANQVKQTSKIVEEFHKSHHVRGSIMPTAPDLIGMIQRMIAISPTVYIVIDALDECQDRKTLLGFLEELRSWNQANLHVLATSRRETDIEDCLRGIATHTTSLEENVVDTDVLTYVEHQLQHDAALSKWPERMRCEIRNVLMDGANGMFRWVECQLDAIRGCMKPAQLRRTLKSLPKTLDDTYARILSNVGEDYVEDVRRILSCLIHAYYPVATEELAETVAVIFEGETYYDMDNQLLEPRNVLTICSGLVTTIKSRRMTFMGGPQIPIEEVRFAHFSVKEYLVSDRIVSMETSKFYMEERLSHEILANMSIRYLIHCHQAKLCEDPDFLVDYETAFLDWAAFAPYAASFWSHHLRAARLDSSSPLYRKCFEIFMDPMLLKNLVKLRRPWFHPEEVTIMELCGYIKSRGGNHQYNLEFKHIPPLFYASLLGLDHLVSMLIDKGEDVNSSNSGGSCLMAAAARGHRSTVELLLAKGADVDAISAPTENVDDLWYSRTALYEAVYNRHGAIARILLAAGADVNIERRPLNVFTRLDDSNSPLQAAVYNSDRDLFELILAAGADPNACAGHLGTALEVASISRSESFFMTMLLDAGADPSLTSDPTGAHSPLWETIVCNNPRGSRLLIERGVDGQTIDSRIVAPVIRRNVVDSSGLEVAVETLIHIRPDINLELVLTTAAKYGYVKAIGLLLQGGTTPNAQERSGTAALHAAAFTPGCNTEAVQVLLDAGADVNLQGGPLGSALQAAALAGKVEVVKTLLERGASVNHAGGLYGRALAIARERLEDQRMICPETETLAMLVPSRIQSYGAPSGYTNTHDNIRPRNSIVKSPIDAMYQAKINIAHLPYADYQGIIDLLLSHGATTA